MWKKPWGYKEGLACGAGLLATGLLLQAFAGNVQWKLLAWPVNIIALLVYLFVLVALFILRKRVYGIEWMTHYTAAVSSLVCVVGITVVMGFSNILTFWPFVLLYLWLLTILGLTILRVGIRRCRLPFLLNHLGLFTVLLTATLGTADMQRLRMITQYGKTEWRATSEDGRLVELPLAIELKDFTIEEYPPKLMLIDNKTGEALPAERPRHLLLEEGMEHGKLLGWDITVLQSIPLAASVATPDTVRFTEFHSLGATYAAYLKATDTSNGQTKEGWVSCGSFMFPYKALRLNEDISLVMPDREPQRFLSAVTVYTQEGTIVEDTITVNHPLSIAGWNIYQLSYDETKGRWSDVSVFELVSDPWLPCVYAGIILMMSGAICLFADARKRGKDNADEHAEQERKEEGL